MGNLLELLYPFTWDGLIIFIIVCIIYAFSFCLFVFTITLFLYWLLGGSSFTETEKPPK